MNEENKGAALIKLQKAAVGLLFPSETDAPLEPFFWPSADSEQLKPETLASLAGVSPDTPIKTTRLESFFGPAVKKEDWHNAEEKAEAERFKSLLTTIKQTLTDVKVFRVGETNITVYIVGTVEDGYAGLKTNVVET